MIGDLTGLAFVVFVFGGGVIRSLLKSWERRMELQTQQQQGQDAAILQQIEALRAEVSALRDTSTQFDVALDRSVQRLEERVGRIEARGSVTSSSPAMSQQIGLR